MNTLHNQHTMRTLIENRQNDLLKEAQVLRLTSGNEQPDDTSQSEKLREPLNTRIPAFILRLSHLR